MENDRQKIIDSLNAFIYNEEKKSILYHLLIYKKLKYKTLWESEKDLNKLFHNEVYQKKLIDDIKSSGYNVSEKQYGKYWGFEVVY